ncbi:MerR family transcriptional regulator [Thermopolyspora sp. NPDC052614]|uniref:MerR family transcriptional regulator n=1 Tax=Thermopolyspora sp. NPDC052614 TaxID=3155682 RepID=UPI003432F9B2
MRISELSAASGVPIPTIKYYLREGLLPQGETTAATRAQYGERHLHRLRLIRALLEVGRLPLASIRQVIAAVEDESLPVHEMLGTAHYALGPKPGHKPGPKPGPKTEPLGDAEDDPAARERWREAHAEVDRLLAALELRVSADAPTRDELAHNLIAMRRLGLPGTAEALMPYAEAALRLVRDYEMGTIPFDGPRDQAVESIVLGTVMYGRAFDVLRRIAHESESARLLKSRPPSDVSDG